MQLQGVSCQYPECLYQRTLWPGLRIKTASVFSFLSAASNSRLISSPIAERLPGPALSLCLFSEDSDRPYGRHSFPFPVDPLSHQLLPSSHSHAFMSTTPQNLGHPEATPGTDSEAPSPGNPQTSHIPQIQRGQRNQGTDHPTNKGEPVINAQNHNHSKPRCPETAQRHKR